MYVRLVHTQQVSGLKAREGFLAVAYRTLTSQQLGRDALGQIEQHLNWFHEHLPEPDRFNRTSSKGAWRRETKGLSWFKPSATEHIEKAFSLALVLKQNGVQIDCIRTLRVGYIVFEDDFQIVAEPFADTPL